MKKKNSIISSFVTIAMCASLMAGGTYALFTSESAVNIAVTSATVNVLASIDEASVQTKKLYDTDYTQGADNMYEGVATFGAKGLTLEKFVPGDGIKFNIVVENKSTVSVKYRTIITCANDDGLFDGLKVNIGEDDNAYDGERHVTNWDMLAVGADEMTVPVSIELPENTGDGFQNKTCTISYAVEAIQGNAYTGPDAIVTKYEEADLPVRNPEDEFFGMQFPEAPDTVTVEAAWTFKATDTDETIVDSPYKDWICDFVIECDGGDVALGELGLWGKYGFFDLAFANPIELPEGQSLFMLTSVGRPFTYEAICTEVKEFDCGVFRGLAGEQMKNKKITVSLCLINPEVAEDLIEEVASRDENKGKGDDEILLEVMKKENWAKYIGTGVLIANQTSYYFE